MSIEPEEESEEVTAEEMKRFGAGLCIGLLIFLFLFWLYYGVIFA